MPIVWTLNGDETSWPVWATDMANSPASPLAEELLTVYKPDPKSTRRALDLGCGVGRAFSPLRRAGFEIVGLDPVLSGLGLARERAKKESIPARLVCGVASLPPLPSSSMDLVLAVGVLFHLSPLELDLALDSINRILRPEGEAILHFLDFSDWRKSLAGVISPEQAPTPGYNAVLTSFCSDDVLEDRLVAGGLRIKSLVPRSKNTERGRQCDWIAYCRKG